MNEAESLNTIQNKPAILSGNQIYRKCRTGTRKITWFVICKLRKARGVSGQPIGLGTITVGYTGNHDPVPSDTLR